MPRQPTCECGECKKCEHRAYMRQWYQAKSADERREWVAKRDPEKVKRADRARYYRDRAKRRALSDRYCKEHPEMVAESRRKWKARNPEKLRAHNIVAYAIKTRKLEREHCEVCGQKAHAHHEDYSKPLEVIWLCPVHHGERHRMVA